MNSKRSKNTATRDLIVTHSKTELKSKELQNATEQPYRSTPLKNPHAGEATTFPEREELSPAVPASSETDNIFLNVCYLFFSFASPLLGQNPLITQYTR